MARTQTSAVMTEAGAAKVEKAKNKAAEKKQQIADLKADLKDERLNAADDKKVVLQTQKSFATNPSAETTAAYKKAVNTYITTVKEVMKIQAKLNKLA